VGTRGWFKLARLLQHCAVWLNQAWQRALHPTCARTGGDMIDIDGYRPNVGIVLLNDAGQLFWARRINRDGWQFPQGGMRSDEMPEEAMFRELEEEIHWAKRGARWRFGVPSNLWFAFNSTITSCHSRRCHASTRCVTPGIAVILFKAHNVIRSIRR